MEKYDSLDRLVKEYYNYVDDFVYYYYDPVKAESQRMVQRHRTGPCLSLDVKLI